METFVVRVHTPVDPCWGGDVEAPALCGVVQHVHSGRSHPFHDAEELGRLIGEAAQLPSGCSWGRGETS